ncbi:hypothetical protein F2Q69_00002092 [Brassica cretica]|uniref:RNase H type-1 domain-containing protein n=1 Tax=Brassica cretica TaxID=69181 RepID=A0A8S9PF58_BRACR|nr:hypothetical protein F2Q69_00002092 [Brassica cretica]
MQEKWLEKRKTKRSWFLAQQVQTRMELTERAEVRKPTVNEPRMLEGWVLCEIGMDWSKTGDIMGAAWITKNSRGKVLEHSRRAFSGSKTVGEAKLQVMLWAIESMRSLKKKKVRFVSIFGDLVEAIGKPYRWPAL